MFPGCFSNNCFYFTNEKAESGSEPSRVSLQTKLQVNVGARLVYAWPLDLRMPLPCTQMLLSLSFRWPAVMEWGTESLGKQEG